jgi:YbbR domain-containing protein
VTLLARVATHWRLKLLALGLAVGLLGAVAFSENPPEYKTVSEKVEYVFPPDNPNANLVLIGPKTSVDVQVFGLRDAIDQYASNAAGVSVDLTNAHPGNDQTFIGHPKSPPSGLNFRSTDIPIKLSIEVLKSEELTVDVKTPTASGVDVTTKIATCGNDAVACQVLVTGPPSLLDGLAAYVNYNASITSAGTLRTPSQKVLFEHHGKPIDLAQFPSQPSPSWAPPVVTVKIDTQGGTQTKQVPITYSITGTQACGYMITRVDVTPTQMVAIHGPVDAVAKVTAVAVTNPIDITGLSSTKTFARTISTGNSQVTSDSGTITVTVNVQQQFTCSAPRPSPTPLPSPT